MDIADEEEEEDEGVDGKEPPPVPRVGPRAHLSR